MLRPRNDKGLLKIYSRYPPFSVEMVAVQVAVLSSLVSAVPLVAVAVMVAVPTVRRGVPGKTGGSAGETGTLGRGSREKLPGSLGFSGR